jgi:hypothetical protein
MAPVVPDPSVAFIDLVPEPPDDQVMWRIAAVSVRTDHARSQYAFLVRAAADDPGFSKFMIQTKSLIAAHATVPLIEILVSHAPLSHALAARAAVPRPATESELDDLVAAIRPRGAR